MQSHEVDFKIIGDDIQLVEIGLDQNETIIAEAGAMVYMRQGIDFRTRMGDGTEMTNGLLGKLLSAGSRVLTGESLFITHFTNTARERSYVAFSAPYPGTIIPIDLKQYGQNIIVQKDAFLCAAYGTRLTLAFNKRLGSGLVGGEGFIMQRLQGDGMAFIHAGGTVIEMQLQNETLRVDTGCVVGFEQHMSFDVQRAGNLRSMMFGGEGLLLATLQGTGKVWLQSMPIRKLIRELGSRGGNARKEGGSLLGGLNSMLGD